MLTLSNAAAFVPILCSVLLQVQDAGIDQRICTSSQKEFVWNHPKGRMSSFNISKKLGLQPLLFHVEKDSVEMSGASDPPGYLPVEVFLDKVQLGGDPVADPEHTEGIIYPNWSANASGSPRRSRGCGRGERRLGFFA